MSSPLFSMSLLVRVQVRRHRPDLWLWLGDNVYSDGTDLDWKRTM